MPKPKPQLREPAKSALSASRLRALFAVSGLVRRTLRHPLFSYTRARVSPRVILAALLAITLAASFTFLAKPAPAQAATASTINFQARLMNASGAIVPDGTYNVEFKLYNASTSSGSAQGSCTGDSSCLWTETRVTGTPDNRVSVQNGYLTVNLGSVTNFPSSFNWGQQLWLSMRIGGTNTTPAWDSEMNPRLLLTAVPAAYSLTQYNTTTGFSSSLTIQPATGGNQTFQIPDQGVAGSYTLCTVQTCTGAAGGSGNTNYIWNQTTQQANSNFNISGTGIASILQAGTFDAASATALNIGTTNATSITLGKSGVNTVVAGTLSVGTTSTYGAITLANGAWLTALDSTGTSAVNMLSVNANNEIQVGAALNVDGGIVLPTNAGQVTLVDLPIDATATVGTKESYSLRVGTTNVLTVYGEADGSGNLQNGRVAIGTSIAPAYALDVAGDVNTTGSFRVNGTPICTSSCAPGSGSGYYIQNGTAVQTGANFNIDGNGTIGGILKVGSSAQFQVDASGNVSTSGTITASNFSGSSSGTNTGNVTLTGTASYLTLTGQQLTQNAINLGTAANITGILPAGNGGTGQSSYAIGDLLYASSGTALSRLADVATGNVLISGGVGVAPSWGKVGLTTTVTGTLAAGNGGTGNAFTAFSGPATSVKTFTLPNASATILTTNAAVTVAQGGTGTSSFTQYGILYGNAANPVQVTAAGTTGQCLVATTSAAPAWGSCGGGAGSGAIGGSGTSGTIAMFTPDGYNIGNSIITQSGTTVSVSGNLTATVGDLNSLKTNGTTRLDASGNLTSIGTIGASGNITTTGGVLTVQGTGTSTFSGSLSVSGTITVPSFGSIEASLPANTVVNTDPTAIAQSPISGIVWHDLFAFDKVATPTFEKYNGTAWSGASLDTGLFAHQENRAVQAIDGTTYTAARWTWNASGLGWSEGQWLAIGFTYNATPANKTIQFESSADGTTWTTRHLSTNNNQNAAPAWFYISDYAGDTYLRLTITSTNAAPVSLSSMRLLTERWGDQGFGSELSYPYTWDGSQNITTGAALTTNGNLAVTNSGTLAVGGSTVFNATGVLQSAAMSGTYSNALTFSSASNSYAGTWNGNTIAVNKGGTNATSIGAAGTVAYSTGSAYAFSAAGTAGQCLVSGGSSAPSWSTCGGGASTLQQAYNNSTSPEFVLNSTNGALTVRDASTSLGPTANLLEVQNNAGTINYLAVTPSGVNIQNAAGSGYATISYTGSTATFAANTGTTQIGTGTGNITANLTGQNDTFQFGKTYSPGASAYSLQDYQITRTLSSTTGTQGGALLQVKDSSTASAGTGISPTLLLLNQAATTGTVSGNLIDAQRSGVSKFKVDVSGNVTTAGSLTVSGLVSCGILQTNASGTLSCGAAPASTLQQAYNNSTSPEFVLNTTNGGITIRNASADAITGNLLEIQNNAGTATFLGVTKTGMLLQNASGQSAMAFDNTTNTLKLYGTGGSANYLQMYYDATNSQGIVAANVGSTVIGNGSGNVSVPLTNTNDVFTFTKTVTTGNVAYNLANPEFGITRAITAGTASVQGTVLKVQDASTGSSVSGDVVLINQSNGSATGNLIRGQLAGVDKFTVSSGGNITASGTLTVNNTAVVKVTSGTAFQVQTAGNATVLDVDTSNSRVGIGTSAPGQSLQITSATDAATLLQATNANLKGTAGQATGTYASNAATGTIAWTNPANASANDGAYATATGTGVTNYLQVSGLGLNVPSNATITGVSVAVARMGTVIPASNATQTFSYTGGQQTFTVPANVTSMTVEAWGAAGGSNAYGGTYGRGGYGGYIKSTINVTPGQTLYIYVGGQGTNGGSQSCTQPTPAGGYNGGGASGYSANCWNYEQAGAGGGASDIRSGGTALANRVVVAGGGGGSSGAYSTGAVANGGDGGYSNGTAGGNNPSGGGSYGGGGGGGTQSGGGGGGYSNVYAGSAGSLGTGGTGGGLTNGQPSFGGGGGGGYYGGGGGGSGNNVYDGAGGGGSSYTSGTLVTYTNGAKTGNGQVTLTYSVPASTVTDQQVSLVRSTGVIGTTNKADTVTAWPTSESTVTYGGSSDLWGETLAPSDVNSPNFGAVVAANIGGGNTASVDQIAVTVYYTAPGTSNWTMGVEQATGAFKLSGGSTLAASPAITATTDGIVTLASSSSYGYSTTVPGSSVSQTFSYSGGQQTYTVPAGVTSLTVEAWGAQGGSAGPYGQGGYGGYIKSTISVTPGQTLYIYVGGQGGNGMSSECTAPGGTAGYNGGGASGYSNSCYGYYGSGGGGGASDVRSGGTVLANRVVVAGGGGGAGEAYGNTSTNGGYGGYTAGANGSNNASSSGYIGGGGGTQTAGGAGGTGGGYVGTAGSLGSGGAGGGYPTMGGQCDAYGGGGGGGYYGGGGGTSGNCVYAAAGGGGSSYTSGTLVTYSNGIQTGNGVVKISYTTSPVTTNYTVAASSEALSLSGSGVILTNTAGNSNTAFQVQNSSGSALFNVDTANGLVSVGSSTLSPNGYALEVQASSSSGYISHIYNSYNGNQAKGLMVDLANRSGTGSNGNIFIGFGLNGTVGGGIEASSNTSVSYSTTAADYAEYFLADQGDLPSSGELVSLAGGDTNKVMRSQYTAPMGIISTAAGFVGNGPVCQENDANCSSDYKKYNVLVSLSGQVPAKVTVANGAIHAGDPITASNIPGVGQKATSAGQIVGYALGSTNSDGTIKVLVQPGYYDPASTNSMQGNNPTFDSMTVNGALAAGSINVGGLASLGSLQVTGDAGIGGNLSVDGDLVVTGLTTVADITINGHIVSGGDAPVVQVLQDASNTNAGTNATVAIDGNDTAGTITLQTGAKVAQTDSRGNVTYTGNDPLAGDMLTFTFNKPYGKAPRILITPADGRSAPMLVYPSGTSTTGFTLSLTNIPAPNTSYSFEYFIIQ